ncbi:hypothetical protein N0V84_005234 [Fusarium piperis]|uniref:Uncharacterized protein n=1 Tax=Fusarium piperis TaxID=1435070 RepID=A0A9W8WE11_9HYPO|nr:hypothetical protein N0V84_005234 [Fusarium piperis]
MYRSLLLTVLKGVGNLGCFSTADANVFATLVAISLYCVSTGILYHLQQRKRYVDVFLVCGVSLGLVIGFVTGMSPREMLFQLIPGSALAALVVSGLGSDVEEISQDSGKVDSI